MVVRIAMIAADVVETVSRLLGRDDGAALGYAILALATFTHRSVAGTAFYDGMSS